MGLQTDVYNELKNKKYYLEKDLLKIFSGEIIFTSYKEKVLRVESILKEIAIIAMAFSLVETYIEPEENERTDK
jgi:hypothetical protein